MASATLLLSSLHNKSLKMIPIAELGFTLSEPFDFPTIVKYYTKHETRLLSAGHALT